MKRIILAIIAVLISITLSYAESCSSGEGSLSYQISGCGEQSRACCGGNWCSWGVTSCASCTDTYTYNDYNCVGNVSNACAGTYRQHYNRSVTDNCGGCSYSGWNHYDTSNWCSYYQSCDRQYTSNTYYGNCGSGSLTYYYYKDASNTCASCTYGDWVHYSSSGDGRQWLQSCDSRQYTSSGDSSGACSGEIRYYYYRDLSNNCNSCDYGSWVHYDTSDSRQYTQSCTATGDSTACSNVSSSYCAGTATRSRSVTGTCGSCSYSDWGGWSTGGCTPWVGCDRQYTSNTYYGNCGSGSLTYYYYRDANNTCGSCGYGDWVHYSSSGDGRQWVQSCDSRQYTSSGDSSGACSGEIRYYYYRDLSNNCNSCDYGSWVHYDTSDSRQYTQSCTATGDSTACSNVSSNYCAGTATRSRSVTGTCGSCSYSDWGGWSTGGCTPWVGCDRQYTSNTYYGNCGSGSLTYYYYRDANNTCGSCGYGDWVHYSSSGDGRQWVQSCDSRQYTSSGDSSGACSGEIRYYYYRDLTNSCNSCDYGSWVHYNTSDSRQYTQSCTDTSTACSNVSSSYCSGTATRSVTGSCGSCSYSGWNTGSCVSTQSCTDTSIACSSLNSSYVSGTATRSVTGACGSCSYSDWDTSACLCNASWTKLTKVTTPFPTVDYTTGGSNVSGCPTCNKSTLGKYCGLRCNSNSIAACKEIALCSCGSITSYTVNTYTNVPVLAGTCPSTTDCASYVTASLCAATSGFLTGTLPKNTNIPSQCRIMRFAIDSNGSYSNRKFGLCTRTSSGCTYVTSEVAAKQGFDLGTYMFTATCKSCN